MRALALLSGGLDSTLAVKLILDHGIDVVAMNFTSPFCLCGRGGCGAVGAAKKFKIPLKIVNKGEDYLKVVREPRYGYGKNMNPCIDCRIYMLREAKKYTEEIGAAFMFTGEVLMKDRCLSIEKSSARAFRGYWRKCWRRSFSNDNDCNKEQNFYPNTFRFETVFRSQGPRKKRILRKI